ncbi:hypothetical protein [Kribbella sp. HUAS MG21]
MAVARHRNTPRETLESLAHDTWDAIARYATTRRQAPSPADET